MRIVISGIPIDIQKKNIKNMHLQIKPPDGHVVISAPLSMDAAKFHLVNDSIEMLGKTMPIIIIVGWEVAIRDCEYQNFISVVTGTRTKPSYPEQRVISGFLSCTGFSLCDLMDFPDNEYRKLVRSWKEELRSTSFIDVLASCRKIIKSKSAGQNVLRYLLYSMNNVVIKCQKQITKNENLSKICWLMQNDMKSY